MKMPFIQLFTGDWLKDPAVSMLSPAARGIWVDFICVMHESDRSGVMRGTRQMLARLVRCSTDELSSALNEYQLCATADITEDDNGVVTVVNRRMKREANARKTDADRQSRHRAGGGVTPSVTPPSRSILHISESEYSDKACKPLKLGGEKKPGTPMGGKTLEAVQLAEKVLNGEWVNDAGKWIGRAQVDAGKVFRVMADVRSAIVEGRVKTTPARMAEFNWGVFK